MIRFFRRYQKTVFGILIFFAALLMVSFNVDFSSRGSSKHSNAAIKIDDIEISHTDFYTKKRDVENRYRQMFGAQYEAMAKQFGLNVAQNVIDSTIQQSLMLRDASARGFQASDDELVSEVSRIFPEGYDPRALRASGKTPELFLKEIDDQVRVGQLDNLLKDGAFSSAREAKALWLRQNAQYDIQYTELNPKDFIKAVKTPSDEELKQYYDDHSEEFKLPERISYEYAAFKPESFMKDIEVSEDEVQLYYSDNQSKYELPEQVKVRQIQFLYPKENDPKKMADVKTKATEALDKAKAGEDFAKLVQQYSDDITTKATGGDIGWITKGKQSKAFDDAAFKVASGGIADLIEEDNGFKIVKVEGHKESSLKPLTDVKAEIEEILKKEQAPAYADTKARDFYDLYTKNDSATLSDLAKEKGYSVSASNGLLSEQADPEPLLSGLTAKLMEAYQEDSSKQMIELKEITVIVSVKDHKASEVPALASIKDKVVASYTNAQSITLAKAKAEALVSNLKSAQGKLLEAAAKELNVELKKQSGVSMSGKLAAPLNGQEMRTALFADAGIPSQPQKVIKEGSSYFVVQQVKKTDADIKNAKAEELLALRQQNGQNLGMLSTKAYADSLKAAAKIDVDPSLLNSES